MMGWIQGTPRWEYNPMRRRNGRCRKTGKEAEHPLEGSLTALGADRGDGNNRFVTISDRT